MSFDMREINQECGVSDQSSQFPFFEIFKLTAVCIIIFFRWTRNGINWASQYFRSISARLSRFNIPIDIRDAGFSPPSLIADNFTNEYRMNRGITNIIPDMHFQYN